VVSFVATTNRADNRALTASPQNVRMAYWTPGNAQPDFALNGRRANAVVVTVGTEARGVFAQVVGSVTGLVMTRKSTAWIANLGSQCVRPWAFPFAALSVAVSGAASSTLDADAFAAYMQRDSSQRMFVILGSTQTSTQPNDGEWLGFNLDASLGVNGFASGFQSCRPELVSASVTAGVAVPPPLGQYIALATNEIDGGGGVGICAMRSGDAGCYPPSGGGAPGVSMNVAWSDPAGSSVPIGFVGRFTLSCYYRASTDVCPTPKPGTPNTGYPPGTVVGSVQGIVSRVLDPADVLGTAPSNVQRLILVQ
jgi:hypothetical protein